MRLIQIIHTDHLHPHIFVPFFQEDKSPTRNFQKKKKKIKHIRLLSFFLLLILAGSAYFYYILVYRVNNEPEPEASQTTMEALYDMKFQRTLIALSPEVKAAAFNGRAAEID